MDDLIDLCGHTGTWVLGARPRVVLIYPTSGVTSVWANQHNWDNKQYEPCLSARFKHYEWQGNCPNLMHFSKSCVIQTQYLNICTWAVEFEFLNIKVIIQLLVL